MNRPNDWQRKTWLDRKTEPQEGAATAFWAVTALLGLGVCVIGLVLSLLY